MRTRVALAGVLVVLAAIIMVISMVGVPLSPSLVSTSVGDRDAGGFNGQSGAVPAGSHVTAGAMTPQVPPPAVSQPASQPSNSSTPATSGRSDNTVIATLSVGSSPASACYDGNNGDVYIGDLASSTVNVINGKTRVTDLSLTVGDGPDAFACNGPGGDVFVANSGSGNVTVVNGASNKVTGSLPAGLSPDGLVYDPFNGELYVADSGSNTVLAVNVSSGAVTASIPVGTSPAGLTYGAGNYYVGENSNGYIYVANHGATTVSVISPASESVVSTIIVGSRPDGVTFNPVYNTVYVSNSGSNTVSVISTASNMVIDTIKVGSSPEGITWDQNTGDIYVANVNSNSVSSIAGYSNQYLADISVGSGPRDLAADVGTGELFVLDGNSDSVSVVTPAAGSVNIATISIPENYPEPIGYDSANGDVYVLDEAGDTVDVIASMGLWTNSIIAIITVGYNPAALAVNTAYGEDGILYVANAGSNTVSVISGASNTVVATVAVGSDPRGIAYDNSNGDVYVNNEGSATASVINGKTNTVIATIPSVNGAGEHTAAQYDPSNGDVYMTSDGGVTVINGATNTIIKTLSLGGPYTMGVDTGNGDVYISDAGSTVWVVSGATNTLAATINGPFASCEGITYDTTNNYLYMGDEDGGNTMWIINGATNAVVGYLNVGVLADGTVYDNVDGDNYVANEQSRTASVIATIFITSVSITPTSSTIPTGGSQVLKAAPVCSGGPCPTGITYSWTMSPGNLGTLNPPSGSTTTFVAGPTAGTVTFTVTATMNNIPITSAAVTVTIIPGLSSVAVSPPSAAVFPNGTQSFTATPGCTGGTCPAGTTYAWAVNNTLGSLSATTGPTTTFTAGPVAGPVTMTVTASLNGNVVVQPVNVSIIPALTTVIVSPSSSIVPTYATVNFTATTLCIGGTCPSVKTYQWSLNNSLGYLSYSTGPHVNFTAGNTVGSVSLVVNVTISGIVRQSAPVLIRVIPGLAKTVVNPSASVIPLNNSRPFSVSISCIGGTCPSGANYSWSLNDGFASLTNLTGPMTSVTAGPVLGNVTLFVNATLDNVTVQSDPVFIVLVPALESVTVQPSPAYIAPGASMQFSATLWCSGGPCSSGAAYSWSLNNSLGSIVGHPGSLATFRAGSATGTTTLFLSVHLDGIVESSLPTNITISYGPPGLMITSVGVTPVPARVGLNMTVTVVVSGGEGDYSYTYQGLPPGCSSADVNPLTCVPKSPGNFTLNVVVKDTAGDTARATVYLNILGKIKPLSVELTTNASMVNVDSSFALTAVVTGGIGPFFYVWSMNSTNSTTAPNTPNWAIVVTTPGLYLFRVWVTDDRGVVAGSQILNVTVQALPQYNQAMAPPSFWWVAVITLVLSLALFAIFTRKRPAQTSETEPITEGAVAGPMFMEAPVVAAAEPVFAAPIVEVAATPEAVPSNVVIVRQIGVERGQPIVERAMVRQPEPPPIMYCSFCGALLGPGPVCGNCGNTQPMAAVEQPAVMVEPYPVASQPSASSDALRSWLEANAKPRAPSTQPPPETAPAPGKSQPSAPEQSEIRGKRVCALCGFELEGSYCTQCKFDWG
jgi:YVTN family beta-propeller protein